MSRKIALLGVIQNNRRFVINLAQFDGKGKLNARNLQGNSIIVSSDRYEPFGAF